MSVLSVLRIMLRRTGTSRGRKPNALQRSLSLRLLRHWQQIEQTAAAREKSVVPRAAGDALLPVIVCLRRARWTLARRHRTLFRAIINRCNRKIYRDRLKGMQILLSNNQAGPGRTVKQEQEEISCNHVQSGAVYHSQGFEDKNLGSSPVCLGSR